MNISEVTVKYFFFLFIKVVLPGQANKNTHLETLNLEIDISRHCYIRSIFYVIGLKIQQFQGLEFGTMEVAQIVNPLYATS